MLDRSAATGTPPFSTSDCWMSFCIVMLMKSYASCLAFEFFGTTQMLPLEPAFSVLPGHRNVPHWNLVISLTSRPYHQVPDTIIGNLPAMNEVPIDSASTPAEFLAT